ncbi:SDR family oxidoreductase [Candidatus Sumerlaeota bacterium]|nr:SDR family oxidoreductase [Candidatus Sumerlaeota bacterium]
MGVLNGKVAVVTGAGNGIGRSHAIQFAKEGAKVVVNDLGCNRDGTGASNSAEEVVKEIKAAGGEAVANGDAVGTMEAGERMIKAAVNAFGKVDIFVNNAGILRDKTILKMSEDEWDLVVKVHLKGTFACLKAAAAQMKEQGTGGSIINTSSSSGLLGNFGQANYGAAKIGIHALTRIAAWELAKFKIRVNCIAPAAITRMTFDLPGIQGQWKPEETGPQHITPIVLFLASDAGAAITGQTFGVEGNELYVYKMMVSHGATRQGSHEPWTQEEIAARLERIVNW